MSPKQLTSRIVKKLITVRALLPIFCDQGAAHLSRWLVDAGLVRAKTRIMLGAFLVVAGGLGASAGAPVWSLVILTAAALIMGPPLWAPLSRRLWVRRILAELEPPSGPSARDSLLELGIEASVVDRLASRWEAGEDVSIAEIDQQNLILSHVGDISHFDGFLIDRDQFEQRIRHRVEIVVKSGILTVQKTYRDYRRFENELLALTALAGLPSVPQLVAVQPKQRILCQTFLPGRNLGSLLVERGVTMDDQSRFTWRYPGIGNWSEQSRDPPDQAHVRATARTVLNGSRRNGLAGILKATHRTGLAVKDVKFGNVLVHGDQVFMCDFDGAPLCQRT